ncbi:carboxymuconolactone decarboxylase family protein [Novosphingobium sp. CCH12-A3]|uniref:carboxymuconolactone decarboxylase family protein n=1 Tax=Novosphingobium sp. CCH12-A3 TaxID=1768752 RepID=UPI000781619C|nr:carboxymuconolactone decarboxylase family protein [Novosphingobium sp. CCH12-A3]
MSKNDEAWANGCEVVDAVYGAGYSEMMQPFKDHRFNQEIVNNQFGNLWADPALSIRDKRLMVLGLTTMLGRPDLIETQMTGALLNDEFTKEQLDLIPHFLLFYAGAGNASALFRGIEAAKAKVHALRQADKAAN